MTFRSAFASPKSGLKHGFCGPSPRLTGFVGFGPGRKAAMMVVAAENAGYVIPPRG